ncbi:MAG: cell filamentation protein Fic, partial [Clostridium sp.]|nr:cell filamentation protein Fic [Clostridium sp.]
MRDFNYREIDNELLIPEIMNLVSRIHGFKGKQELYIEAKPDILKNLLEVAKIQSTGASNRIEGISTSNARLKQLVSKKTEPMNRDEEEIAGYIEVLDTINESYKDIHLTSDVILQLHRDLYSFHPSAQGGQFKNQENIIEEVSESGTRQLRFKPLS